MSQSLREQAVRIYTGGLSHITPEALLRATLHPQDDALAVDFLEGPARVELRPGGRIFLLCIGKAAAPMAEEAARMLAGRVHQGLVITKHGFGLPGLPWPVLETGHPVPDQPGADAAVAVEAMLSNTEPDDLVVVMVSGGASALLPAPLEGIGLAQKQDIIDLMLRTNMDIHQINMVRKAISRFKGGGLARLAAPARVLGLYLSDVPGDNLSSIGSGPTVPEAVNGPAVIALLREKGIWDKAPAQVRAALEARGTVPAEMAQAPLNGLIGTNRHLLRAMADVARKAGFTAHVEEQPTTGLNPEAMPGLLQRWEALCARHGAGPLCLISGGETTVEITGNGMGGRCQELAAMMLPRMDGDTVFLAAGSDGNDGPTDAAGGVVDAESWQRIQAGGIPYEALLADNDSYHLLERSGNLIKVPPTRNNVMDVHLFLRQG